MYIRCVISDWDGTLTKTAGEQFRNDFLPKQGREEKLASDYDRLIEQLNLGKMNDLLLPGAKETILEMLAAGIKFIINSNNDSKIIKAILLHNGFSKAELEQITIYGKKENGSEFGYDNLDKSKIKRVMQETTKHPAANNEVAVIIEDSKFVVNGVKSRQGEASHLRIISTESGQFKWSWENIQQAITQSDLEKKPVTAERRRSNNSMIKSLFFKDSPCLLAAIAPPIEEEPASLILSAPDSPSNRSSAQEPFSLSRENRFFTHPTQSSLTRRLTTTGLDVITRSTPQETTETNHLSSKGNHCCIVS
jgi:phosphoglycolate phosphatase-like HAD superfamily hydrolase